MNEAEELSDMCFQRDFLRNLYLIITGAQYVEDQCKNRVLVAFNKQTYWFNNYSYSICIISIQE